MYHTEDNICEQMLKYSSTHNVLKIAELEPDCIKYTTYNLNYFSNAEYALRRWRVCSKFGTYAKHRVTHIIMIYMCKHIEFFNGFEKHYFSKCKTLLWPTDKTIHYYY